MRLSMFDARRFGIPATVEQVVLASSLFWLLSANRLFFANVLNGRPVGEAATWGLMAGLGVLLAAGQAALLLSVLNRWTVKPLLTVLIVVTALASYFMDRLGIYLDPSMVRNVLRTHPAEARELLTVSLLPHLLLYAALPLAVLWQVRIVHRPLKQALLWRAMALVATLAIALCALLSVFQPLSSLMRNHKELRYLVTPANYLWSIGSVMAGDLRGAAQPRQPIGLDATPGPSWAQQSKPRLMVLVVGETARAANWGLNGYARQTTPELARLPVINFGAVQSCGTNTEVSLPCMFAPVGRRDYNEQRIRGSQSLLHVLARAGVDVHWRDNQSGCKGVCDGLSSENVRSSNPPGLCSDGQCLDEALLADLDHRLDRLQAQRSGTQLLVLHMLGNHGPSYFRRYPPAFERFKPACQNDDLQRCSQQEIVNAYDNALLYTDHLLAALVTRLQQRAQRLDAVMVYVSDHGESLGESRLFLHGMPYAIAPDVQKQVPMVMWTSAGFGQSARLDKDCLHKRAQQGASHDHLFHSVLGLLDVRTALYERAFDLTADCRPASARP